MGPFGENVYNGGNVRNVPVYAISSGPAYTFHGSASPLAGWRVLIFAYYLGKKRSV